MPGDLLTLTIADCVESVAEDIEDAGLGGIVLVGQASMRSAPCSP